MCIASSAVDIPDQSGTSVTTDEPILTNHYHPKSMFTLKFTLGVIYSMSLSKCIMTCINILLVFYSLLKKSSVLCLFILYFFFFFILYFLKYERVMIIVLVSSSANSNICVGPGSISIDWYFSCLFSCLVTFDWMPDIGGFTWLGVGCFYIPIIIHRLCSRYLLSTPHNDPESWGFPVWLLGNRYCSWQQVSSEDCSLSPTQMSLSCLGVFLTRMYCWVLQENFLQTSRLFSLISHGLHCEF